MKHRGRVVWRTGRVNLPPNQSAEIITDTPSAPVLTGDTMKGDLRPATGDLDRPLRCDKCDWRGLRSQAVRAAVNDDTGSYVAQCPACGLFALVEDTGER